MDKALDAMHCLHLPCARWAVRCCLPLLVAVAQAAAALDAAARSSKNRHLALQRANTKTASGPLWPLLVPAMLAGTRRTSSVSPYCDGMPREVINGGIDRRLHHVAGWLRLC